MNEIPEHLKNVIPVLNVVVTVVVILFVTLAMGQMVVFNLTKETKKNLLVHQAIAYLGMGTAFYALFVARLHFSTGGWVGLVGTVIGIALVGSIIQKIRKGPSPKIKVSEKNVVTWIPDEKLSWCLKCREHTELTKIGRCVNCRGTIYGVFVPKGNRQASYGCSGCAAVPALISICAVLARWGPGNGWMITALMAVCFVPIICFPIFFIYQYRRWLKWARQREMHPHRSRLAEEESEVSDPPSVEDEESSAPPSDTYLDDGFLSD